MKKFLQLSGVVGLLGVSLVFGGCGDDSDDWAVVATTGAVVTTTGATVTTTVTTTGATVTTTLPGAVNTVSLSSTTTTGAATAAADVFKLAASGGSAYAATITGGFNVATDKVSVPVGSTNPSALAGGVNDVVDGKVDLTWSSAGQLVTIHFTDLTTVNENLLVGNAENVKALIYTTY